MKHPFAWPVILKNEIYMREAKLVNEWGDDGLLQIKTEKGRITITLGELKTLIKHFSKKNKGR